jgi:hypothetical protein
MCLRRCCGSCLVRLRNLLLGNIDPHSLVSNLCRASLMSLRYTRCSIAPLPARHTRSCDDLLLTRIVALSKVITVARLALVVTTTFRSQTRVA